MFRLVATLVFLFTITWAGVTVPAQAGEKFITIGTGGGFGIYYPAGGAICRLLKRDEKEHGIRCFVEQSSGSVYNLKALRAGELDLAFAQTDLVSDAYKGIHDFSANGPDTSLRSVFLLHTETFTILARADAGIKTIKDLQGKRIGIGYEGSGMRATAEEFIKAEGWGEASFAQMLELKPDEQAKALCGGKVDAVLSTSGHPNGIMREMTHTCPTTLIAVEGPEIDKLLKENPYYLRVSLPGAMYQGSPETINTFGIKAMLVTSSKTDEDTIYQVVKAVFGNFDNFKSLHPAFSNLEESRMIGEGLGIPLHPGALRYYREVGLIK